MGKAKKSAPKKRPSKPYSRPAKPGAKPASSRKPTVQPNPVIPFNPTDRILLVGEGDFSFSHSLLTAHNCTSLLATSFDTHPVVLAKYPQAASNIQALGGAQSGESHVLYDVDATRIGTGGVRGGGKPVKRGGFDKIVFNFPHVGGLTKDVDRQIRHNQELLLGFLRAAGPLLASNGAIVVTIFEGQPYDRWDLRGLARNAGLKAQRSFKFQSSAYPGYRHARTLGNLEGDGGWKGEERPARSYVLEVDGKVISSGKAGENEGIGATGSNMVPITCQRNANGKRNGRQDSDDTDSEDG